MAGPPELCPIFSNYNFWIFFFSSYFIRFLAFSLSLLLVCFYCVHFGLQQGKHHFLLEQLSFKGLGWTHYRQQVMQIDKNYLVRNKLVSALCHVAPPSGEKKRKPAHLSKSLNSFFLSEHKQTIKLTLTVFVFEVRKRTLDKKKFYSNSLLNACKCTNFFGPRSLGNGASL